MHSDKHCKKGDPEQHLLKSVFFVSVNDDVIDDSYVFHMNMIVVDHKAREIYHYEPSANCPSEGDVAEPSRLQKCLKLCIETQVNNIFKGEPYRMMFYDDVNNPIGLRCGPQRCVDYGGGLCMVYSFYRALLEIWNPELPYMKGQRSNMIDLYIQRMIDDDTIQIKIVVILETLIALVQKINTDYVYCTVIPMPYILPPEINRVFNERKRLPEIKTEWMYQMMATSQDGSIYTRMKMADRFLQLPEATRTRLYEGMDDLDVLCFMYENKLIRPGEFDSIPNVIPCNTLYRYIPGNVGFVFYVVKSKHFSIEGRGDIICLDTLLKKGFLDNDAMSVLFHERYNGATRDCLKDEDDIHEAILIFLDGAVERERRMEQVAPCIDTNKTTAQDFTDLDILEGSLDKLMEALEELRGFRMRKLDSVLKMEGVSPQSKAVFQQGREAVCALKSELCKHKESLLRMQEVARQATREYLNHDPFA